MLACYFVKTPADEVYESVCPSNKANRLASNKLEWVLSIEWFIVGGRHSLNTANSIHTERLDVEEGVYRIEKDRAAFIYCWLV